MWHTGELDFIDKFKKENGLEKRKILSTKLKLTYPGIVPIVVGPVPNQNLGPLRKNKFLLLDHFTVATFMNNLRTQGYLESQQNIFLFCNNVMLVGSMNIGDIYNRFKNEDGFLYIRYGVENTFG